MQTELNHFGYKFVIPYMKSRRGRLTPKEIDSIMINILLEEGSPLTAKYITDRLETLTGSRPHVAKIAQRLKNLQVVRSQRMSRAKINREFPNLVPNCPLKGDIKLYELTTECPDSLKDYEMP